MQEILPPQTSTPAMGEKSSKSSPSTAQIRRCGALFFRLQNPVNQTFHIAGRAFAGSQLTLAAGVDIAELAMLQHLKETAQPLQLPPVPYVFRLTDSRILTRS